MDPALHELVRRRALFRCEYCGIPEVLVTTPFQIDHIIARSHRGRTEEQNLAFACFHCNNFKGTNVAGVDVESGEVVRLFNPRRDNRSDHFAWKGAQLGGLSSIGRVTIEVLRLNQPHRVAIRLLLLREGVSFPT